MKTHTEFKPSLPLTRGWLIGIGLILAQALWENEWWRIRGGALAFALYCALLILALIRYPGQIIFAGFWVYLILIVTGLGPVTYGWIMAQRVYKQAKSQDNHTQ